jgi:hypothetical protein
MFEMLKRVISQILDGIEFVIHILAFIGGAPSKFQPRTFRIGSASPNILTTGTSE